MQIDWALLLAVGAPVLAAWGTFRYFSGKVQQWMTDTEEATKEWREEVASRLRVIEDHIRNTGQAVVATKVETLTAEVWALRKWKHVRGEPYVAAMDALRQRIECLERANGGRDES